MSETKDLLQIKFTDLLAYAIKWRKHLMILAIVAIVLSAAISFIIKPKYKAEVIFYPTTINSIGNSLFTDLNKREADPLAFGEELEAENALQLLSSSAMTGRIIKDFDLMKHYDIEPKANQARTKLANKFNSNIDFERTRYLSIKISVLDESPEMAARIANGIAEIYDTVKTEIQMQLARQAFQIIESEYRKKEKEITDIRDNLKKLAENGVTNYEEQARALAEEIAKLQSRGGSSSQLQQLRDEQALLSKYAGDFLYYTEYLKLELDALDKLRTRYEKAKVDVDKTITHKFLLTAAEVPEIKAYPMRKTMVLMSLLVTLFVGFLGIIILEKYRDYKAQQPASA
jgi:capsular polysaccharide biosynthesis protein